MKRRAKVGVRGFEPPISRPPDAHFNRTKLHPENVCKHRRNLFNFLKLTAKSSVTYGVSDSQKIDYNQKKHLVKDAFLVERVKGFKPSTPTLARWCSNH